MKTIRALARQRGILLLTALLLLPLGCNGPAEEAGEDLDEKVEEIRQESSRLQQQISDYQQQIDRAREELKNTRTELLEAKTELAELRRQRDQIIGEMKNLQQEDRESNANQEMEGENARPGGQ